MCTSFFVCPRKTSSPRSAKTIAGNELFCFCFMFTGLKSSVSPYPIIISTKWSIPVFDTQPSQRDTATFFILFVLQYYCRFFVKWVSKSMDGWRSRAQFCLPLLWRSRESKSLSIFIEIQPTKCRVFFEEFYSWWNILHREHSTIHLLFQQQRATLPVLVFHFPHDWDLDTSTCCTTEDGGFCSLIHTCRSPRVWRIVTTQNA